jgi:hypothetical protein
MGRIFFMEQAYNNAPKSEEYVGFTEIRQWDDGHQAQ